MKIKSMCVQNFGSIKKVKLDELTDLAILVGKNGSGKSFLLEALHKFFSEFSTVGGGTPSWEEHLWFDRNTDQPIVIALWLVLQSEEAERVFAASPKELAKVRDKSGEESDIVQVKRELEWQKGWKTALLRYGNLDLVVDNEYIALQELANLAREPESLGAYRLYLFAEGYSKDNIGGPRLLVNEAQATAYNSSAAIDSLAARGLIDVSTEAVGIDFRQWVVDRLNYYERPPTAGEAPEIYREIDATSGTTSPQELANRLTELIKGAFKLIPASRAPQAAPGSRVPVLDSQTQTGIQQLLASRDRADSMRKYRLREQFRTYLSKELDQGTTIRQRHLELPLQHIGGGEQEMLGLLWGFLNPDSSTVFAIEEPESHLHPTLCRQVFTFLKDRSAANQIFLSTHSPTFVEPVEVRDNWVCAFEQFETKIRRVEGRDDLRQVLAELGCLPSDVLMSDLTVFVEGTTEHKAVLPMWGQTLGVSIEHPVEIKCINGAGNLRKYLEAWLQVNSLSGGDYLVVLDKDQEREKGQLVRRLKLDEGKFHIWRKGTIEDYYPVNLVVDGLREIYNIEVEEARFDTDKPMQRQIGKLLADQHKAETPWKTRLGGYVASRMEPEDIDDQIKSLFDRVRPYTRSE